VLFVKNRVSKVQMLIPGETFSESYPARPESVGEARNALTSFAQSAGADPETLDTIRLATSEAVTNAVMHAYDKGKAGTVQISASYVEDELWLLIADTGKGLRPRSNSPGLGLGLALIAQLADEFQILSRGSGGTELRLRFRLAVPQKTPERTDRVRSDAQPRRQARGSVSTALSPA
jgi:serine/threonine-protein kinase RsbW